MATTYTWSIPTLEYYPTLDGLNQVVHIIHWVYAATDGTYSSSVYGTQSLNTSDLNPDQFIVYADLTQQTVESWLEGAMGAARVQELQTLLQTNIDNMINPPNVVTNPPWAPSEPMPSSEIPLDVPPVAPEMQPAAVDAPADAPVVDSPTGPVL